MKFYCMTVHKSNRTTAGAKAPDDVSAIMKGLGARELVFSSAHKFKNINLTRFWAMFVGIWNWIKVLIKVDESAYVVIQHPNENIIIANSFINLCKKIKKLKFVFLIHDLESLRKNIGIPNGVSLESRSVIADEVLLKKAEYIISHNESMTNYLVSRGFEKRKIVDLQIFDYLHQCELPQRNFREHSVIVAGNLLKEKAGYLYKLMEQKNLDFTLNLFGPNYTAIKENKNVHYYGQCLPDELPNKLEGTFGLVWDGTELNECKGNAGEYIKYNNPHKCSLFLASNIPVIIWKNAALAPFIEKNGVGITINSLNDIAEKLERLTDIDYNTMVKNTKKLGEKLRNGYFLKNVIEEIMSRENL